MKLGKLEEVAIRDVWQHEQYDFSAWLAKDENIKELGDSLNLSLTDVETEKFVGSYRCDIICKDEITGKNVLIENQLEPTNHDHLGKIITYASGLNASVVIWIVETAKPEHSSAIEWLNKYTTDELSFFLIEIHAYKIGTSEPAPMFKIIEQPNDFAKTVNSIAKNDDITEGQSKRLEFWTMFNEYIEKNGKPIKTRKPSTSTWYAFAIGSSQCHAEANLVNSEHRIRIALWIPDNKELFDKFHANKEDIETTIGKSLEWERMDDKKASSINYFIPNLDFNNQDNYPELFKEILELFLLFRDAFSKYI